VSEPTAADDSRLIEAAQRGDRTAFETLVTRHKVGLFRLARRFLGNGDDAYDVVQDTFVSVWLALGRFLTSLVNAGGTLAWQLGHNDFAPKERLSAYMGIHVTLTGVRGAVAPFAGMALYLGWDAKGHVPGSTGLGVWLFVLSALLGVVAWRGFARLLQDMKEAGLADGVRPPV
jgi:hypothetical protein